MGVCFGCVLPLREGAVRDLRNGELTVAAPGDGVAIQTCISAAAGALRDRPLIPVPHSSPARRGAKAPAARASRPRTTKGTP